MYITFRHSCINLIKGYWHSIWKNIPWIEDLFRITFLSSILVKCHRSQKWLVFPNVHYCMHTILLHRCLLVYSCLTRIKLMRCVQLWKTCTSMCQQLPIRLRIKEAIHQSVKNSFMDFYLGVTGWQYAEVGLHRQHIAMMITLLSDWRVSYQ